MQKKLLIAFAASSAIGLTLGLFSVWMMIPTPFEFYLLPGAGEAQRIELRDRLAKDLLRFEELENDPIASGMNDLDRLRPVDTTKIAHAIQVYTLEHEELPQSMEELFSSGLIAPASLEGSSYTLQVTNGEWGVYTQPGYFFAKGN